MLVTDRICHNFSRALSNRRTDNEDDEASSRNQGSNWSESKGGGGKETGWWRLKL